MNFKLIWDEVNQLFEQRPLVVIQCESLFACAHEKKNSQKELQKIYSTRFHLFITFCVIYRARGVARPLSMGGGGCKLILPSIVKAYFSDCDR